MRPLPGEDMLSHEDNRLLVETGPSTAMGGLMREFWVPVLLSRELPAPDCPPKKLRVMGEDLLAFRDSSGAVGLIDPVCPHRGANLYFGRNEEEGIRCVYHGWKFNRLGQCVELPTAEPDSDYKNRISLKAYPTQEWGDMVWAYMGQQTPPPPLPRMEFALVPPSHRYVSKKWQDCNWAQCVEGAIDTAHFSFLHMLTGELDEAAEQAMKFAAIGAQTVKNDRIRWVKEDTMPTFEVLEFPAGLTIGGARRADGDNKYWRIAQFLMPNHAYAPSAFPGENYHGQSWVPHDDHGCWIFTYTWNPDRPLTEEERTDLAHGHTVHATVDENYRPLRGPHNDYLIDREKQKTFSFTGIDGVSEQDAAIQDSMGPIVDRTREHLGPTDIGVVRFRRYLLGAIKNWRDEGLPPPQAAAASDYAVRSGGWIAHQDKSLAEVMTERFGHEYGLVQPAASMQEVTNASA